MGSIMVPDKPYRLSKSVKVLIFIFVKELFSKCSQTSICLYELQFAFLGGELQGIIVPGCINFFFFFGKVLLRYSLGKSFNGLIGLM